MGWWENTKKTVKKAVKDTGNAVGKGVKDVAKVLPSPGQIVGSAALGAPGMVVGGRVDPITSDLQRNIGEGVALAGAGIGAGQAIGAGGGAAAGGAGGAIPVATDDPTGMIPGGAGGAIPNAPGSGSGSSWTETLLRFGGDIAKAAAAFASEHGQTALEVMNVVNAAQRQAQADKYAKGALEGTEQRFADKAGLRSSGIAGMMNPSQTAPDLSNLRAIANAPRDPSKLASIAGPQSGNPFAGAVPPRTAIPNAGPSAPQVYDTPNPMAPGALPIAAPPTLAPGAHPATGQRPQPPYDPRKLPLPIATRLGG